MDKAEKDPTISTQISTTDKLPQYGTRLYRGVYISKESLKSVLELELHKYGLDDKLGLAEQIIQAESGWNVLADNSVSKGILQFTEPTWARFCVGDIFDPYLQIQCATKLWSQGKWYFWDTYCFAHYDIDCIRLRGLKPK